MDEKLIQNGLTHQRRSEVPHTVVRFTDDKMTSAAKRGRGSFLTRRSKCVMVSLVISLACVLLLMSAGLFSAGPMYSGELCKLNDVTVQEGFDKKQFQGVWFGAFTKGLDNSMLAKLLEFYDVKIRYILKDDGNFDILSVGGKFYGMWCPEGEGHADIRDPESPQKFAIYFDTPTGKKFGTRPGWVVKTDYTSYAVVYSCWEETNDGFCKSNSAYAVVMTRNREPLPQDKMAEVRSALSRSCINPDALKPIKHEGYCKGAQRAIDRQRN